MTVPFMPDLLSPVSSDEQYTTVPKRNPVLDAFSSTGSQGNLTDNDREKRRSTMERRSRRHPLSPQTPRDERKGEYPGVVSSAGKRDRVGKKLLELLPTSPAQMLLQAFSGNAPSVRPDALAYGLADAIIPTHDEEAIRRIYEDALPQNLEDSVSIVGAALFGERSLTPRLRGAREKARTLADTLPAVRHVRLVP